MRVVGLGCWLLLLAGCTSGPQALGITGPNGTGVLPPPATAAEPADPLDNPELLHSGTRYAPTYTPSTGGGHYWGYN